MTNIDIFLQQIEEILSCKWKTELWKEKQVKTELRHVKFRLAVLATLFEKENQKIFPDLKLKSGEGIFQLATFAITIENEKLGTKPLLLWTAVPCQCCNCGWSCDPSNSLSDSSLEEWNRETVRLEIKDTAKFFAKWILVFLVVLVAAYYYLFLWKY